MSSCRFSKVSSKYMDLTSERKVFLIGIMKSKMNFLRLLRKNKGRTFLIARPHRKSKNEKNEK